MSQPAPNTAGTLQPTNQNIMNSSITEARTRSHNLNIGFAIAILIYEILALPVYGVLFGLSPTLASSQPLDGLYLIVVATILTIVGFGLINAYISKSSFTGMTYTLVIFVLTIQHFFLFRAFWSKAGAADYNFSSKTFSTGYGQVTLANDNNNRQVSSFLASGPFVQAIGCAISLIVAFSSIIGRVSLLEVFFLTLFGSFLYEVNSQLLFRWFITDVAFGYRIFIFGGIFGVVTALLLGRSPNTTKGNSSYTSQYRFIAFALLGFAFTFVSLPILTAITLANQTPGDQSILWASSVNAWLAVVASVLGVFTSNAIFYGKFHPHDLIFLGTTGAFALGMQHDITFNTSAPLIVGFVVAFVSAIKAPNMNRAINKGGVWFSLPTINRFLIPGLLGSIATAVIQASSDSANGPHGLNRLSERTAIQQGGWQLVGFLISAATAIIAGLIVGLICKLINKRQYQSEQFDDRETFKQIDHINYPTN